MKIEKITRQSEYITVGVWNGKNFTDILQNIIKVNTEIRIRIQGRKLIIKHENYYRCIPAGEEVEIPNQRMIEQDEPYQITDIMDEERIQRHREWGIEPVL